jgi:hypothetical protein
MDIFNEANVLYDDTENSSLLSYLSYENSAWYVDQIQLLRDNAEGFNDPLSLDDWVDAQSTTAGCEGEVKKEKVEDGTWRVYIAHNCSKRRRLYLTMKKGFWEHNFVEFGTLNSNTFRRVKRERDGINESPFFILRQY